MSQLDTISQSLATLSTQLAAAVAQIESQNPVNLTAAQAVVTSLQTAATQAQALVTVLTPPAPAPAPTPAA